MNDLDNLQQQIEKTRLRLAANLTVLTRTFYTCGTQASRN